MRRSGGHDRRGRHRRRRGRRIRQLRQKLGTLRNRAAGLARGTLSGAAVAAAGRLRDETGTLDAGREALKARRPETPKHVTVAQPDGRGRPEALPPRERLPRDIVRMISCRAETRMMSAVAEAQGAKRRPRRPLAELFRSDADIIPDPDNGILRVRIPGTAGDAGDAVVAGLPEELNQTRTIFPRTRLRMVYELPKRGAEPGERGS